MIQSVRQIFQITSTEDLKHALDQFETELDAKVQPLVDMLQQNMLSTDVTSVELHMSFVESWRVRVVKYLSLASAFVEHAKDSTFLPAKATPLEGEEKPTKMSEIERDAYRRKMAGGFVALQIYLEGLVDSIDSRVNLCKKVMGIEIDAPRGRQV
jgi:hypothetical protein